MFDFLHPQQAASNFGWWNAPKPPRNAWLGSPAQAVPGAWGGQNYGGVFGVPTRYTGRPFQPPTILPPTPVRYTGPGFVNPNPPVQPPTMPPAPNPWPGTPPVAQPDPRLKYANYYNSMPAVRYDPNYFGSRY